jgi:predicted AAA+ superfamily ATPase
MNKNGTVDDFAQNFMRRNREMNWLWSFYNANLIKVVSGVRRCGKSTLLKMFRNELLQKGVDPKQIQFYNFEELETHNLGSDIYQINTSITSQFVADQMNYIFLDEVQNVFEFEKLVDSLYVKSNTDIYITGSNAYFLSGDLATFLTGRYVQIEMTPYSFGEYHSFVESNSQKLTISESFANFSLYGGIPEYINLVEKGHVNADDFVNSLLNTIIEKDIFTRNTIYNRSIFNKIVDFVFDNIGSNTSANSIRTALKGANIAVDNQTVSNYLQYLCDAMLLYKVPRYDIKGRGLLQTLDKYYLVDLAFRRVRLGKKTSEDLGYLLENIVYLELRRRYRDVYVGKLNGFEVDFITISHTGKKSYFQVAYTVKEKATLQRELKPLQSIHDSYPKYLLSTDLLEFDNNGIELLNIERWLLDRRTEQR